MKKKTAGQQLRDYRKKMNWSQHKLSEKTGLQQSRISRLERDKGHPSSQEWALLRKALDMPDRDPPPALEYPYPRRSWHVRQRDLHRRSDVPLSVRVAHARKSFGPIIDTLMRELERRLDRQPCMSFLEEALLDSGDELVLWARLLNTKGAVPCWFAPNKAGFRHFRLVDGRDRRTACDRRMPAVEIDREEYAFLFYPQVTVDTRRAYYRLDTLVCVIHGTRRCWVNVELDGGGHDARFDAERADNLRIPTIRLRPADLLAPEFAEKLESRLLEVLQAEGEDDEELAA